MNFLIFCTIFLPFCNFLLIFIKKTDGEIDQIFAHTISKICSVIFIAILLGLVQNQDMPLYLSSHNHHFDLILKANTQNLKQLFTIGAIWLLLSFYHYRFSIVTSEKNSQFIIFLPLAITFLNISILAQNLNSLFFAQFLIILLFSFIFCKFFHDNPTKSRQKGQILFIFIIFFEIIAFFLLIITLNHYFNSPILNSGINKNFNPKIPLLLFLFSIFSSIFSLAFFLYQKRLKFTSTNLFSSLIFTFFLPKIIILSKISAKILPFSLISLYFGQNFVIFLEILFAGAIISTLILILFSRDFYATLFYLILNQSTLALLAIFIRSCAEISPSPQIFSNFALNITLIFFIFSNITIYFQKSQKKRLDGIFPDFKITISLLIFALLNCAAILPPFGSEIAFLAKISLKNQLFITFLTIFINSVGLIMFTYKLISPSFQLVEGETVPHDQNLAKKIDFSSQLSLTACIICVIMLLKEIIL